MSIDRDTYTAKATHKALTVFGMDLASIRAGFSGGHFDAETTAEEFRAACAEAGRRLTRLDGVA